MLRSVKYFMMLMFVHSLFTTAYATIINAPTCNGPDVSTTISAAKDGDTVVVPPGTCTWTSNVYVPPKAITIQGAGIDQTIIVDGVPKGVGEDRLLRVDTQEGTSFRLTGLTFQGGNTAKGFNGAVVIFGTSKNWRIDHVKFDQLHTQGLRIYDYTYGVIDHCVFNLDGTQGIVLWHNAWLGYEYGNGSFNDGLHLGTEQAVYVEDTAFINAAKQDIFDSEAGGRLVFRYNTVTNDYLGFHGTDSSAQIRSVRSYEIYNNTFTNTVNDAWPFAIYLRGGTGVIFNNTFTGFKSGIIVANYRSRSYYTPWGQCDGTNPYDGNTDSLGYPCIDQVGRGTGDLLSGYPPTPVAWPHQASEPVYAWNNTWTPVPNSAGNLMSNDDDVIRVNRDYFTNTIKPGYTPYPYPHPLTTGTTSAPPNPPQNLRVLSQ